MQLARNQRLRFNVRIPPSSSSSKNSNTSNAKALPKRLAKTKKPNQTKKTQKKERPLTAPRTYLTQNLMQRLHHTRQPLHPHPLLLQRLHNPPMLLPHRTQLRRDFPRKLDAVLHARVGLERFTFDFVEEVGAAAQEFVV